MNYPNYRFSNNWFEGNKPIWLEIFHQLNPLKVLEVGSYEGQSAVFALQAPSVQEVVCIDSWGGGVEHAGTDMNEVEHSFDLNVQLAKSEFGESKKLRKLKGVSLVELSKLVSSAEKSTFDFVYIDGSHQAPDVLADAVLGFELLRPGGVMAFDDYLWFEELPTGIDPLRCPKPAIDAFVNINIRRLRVVRTRLHQLYITKVR